MSRILWSNEARSDLENVADYFARFDPDLPNRLLQRIERAPMILIDYPGLDTPARRRGVRKWPVKGTPFVLFYRTSASGIEVVHVAHHRMDDR